MLIIQALWSNGIHIEAEWPSKHEDPISAILEAKKYLNNPTCEASSVRVITSDCELVWDSRNE